MKKIKGQQITDIHTIKSMYDNNCVVAFTRGTDYRLPVSEIIKMINDYEFEVEKKKVHSYLINAKRID